MAGPPGGWSLYHLWLLDFYRTRTPISIASAGQLTCWGESAYSFSCVVFPYETQCQIKKFSKGHLSCTILVYRFMYPQCISHMTSHSAGSCYGYAYIYIYKLRGRLNILRLRLNLTENSHNLLLTMGIPLPQPLILWADLLGEYYWEVCIGDTIQVVWSKLTVWLSGWFFYRGWSFHAVGFSYLQCITMQWIHALTPYKLYSLLL